MRIGLVGTGRIGANLAARWTAAGHEVLASYSRDPGALRARADAVGARSGTVAEAAEFGDVVAVSVPWTALDDVAAQVGDLGGRVLLDTTNQYGPSGPVTLPRTAAEENRRRFGARSYAKAFNTVTAAFQAAAVERPADRRPAMFFVADEGAREATATLVADVGFVPVWLAGPDRAELLESPRRDGAVYGEEYRPDDAERIAAEWRAGGDAARLARELKLPD